MVAATNRMFYSNEYKAKVIAQVERDGISETARKNGIAYNLVHNWAGNWKAIAKAAEKELKQAAKKSKRVELVKAERVDTERETSGRVLVSEAVRNEGPEFTVRGFGPWLVETVRRELPAVVEASFDGLVEKRLDALIEKKVREAIRRALHEGTNGAGE